MYLNANFEQHIYFKFSSAVYHVNLHVSFEIMDILNIYRAAYQVNLLGNAQISLQSAGIDNNF